MCSGPGSKPEVHIQTRPVTHRIDKIRVGSMSPHPEVPVPIELLLESRCVQPAPFLIPLPPLRILAHPKGRASAGRSDREFGKGELFLNINSFLQSRLRAVEERFVCVRRNCLDICENIR